MSEHEETPPSSPPSVPSPRADLPLVPLAGSNRQSADIIVTAPVGQLDRVEIEATVVLRRRSDAGTFDPSVRLGREEFASRMGADAADAATVTATLGGLGVRIVSTDLASRRVRVAGSASVLGRVFGTHLEAVTSRAAGGGEVLLLGVGRYPTFFLPGG